MEEALCTAHRKAAYCRVLSKAWYNHPGARKTTRNFRHRVHMAGDIAWYSESAYSVPMACQYKILGYG